MSGIRTNAAAELLGVSPNTLRSWERRFGYPQAPPHRRWAPPVRAGRARGAAPRPARDPQHLLRDRGRPPARRGPELAQPPARRVRPLRRGRRRPDDGGEPRRPLGRPHRRGGAAARRSRWPRAATSARPSGSWPAAGPPGGCTPPAAWCRPRPAPRACSCSTPPSSSTTSRCTCRRSSWPSAAPASARCSSQLRPAARARGARDARRRPDRVRLLRRRGHARGAGQAGLHRAPGRLGRPGVRVPRVDARDRRSRHPVAGLHADRGRRAPQAVRGHRPAGAGGRGGRGRGRDRASAKPGAAAALRLAVRRASGGCPAAAHSMAPR